MSTANLSVDLPAALLHFAQELADRDGTSLENWLSKVLVDRIVREHEAETFFQERRERAIPGAFHELLRRVPNAPPMPGDELE